MSFLSDFIGAGLGGGPLDEVIHNLNYTFQDEDEDNKLHKSTDANPYTWTIPLEASVPFQIGSVFTIFNSGAGDLTLTADGAATLREAGTSGDGDIAVPRDTLCTVLKVGSDEWVFSGGDPSGSEQLTETLHNSNYNFTAGDEFGKLHVADDGSNYTWTLPLNATVAFNIGSVIPVYNDGSGNITITAAGAATLKQDGSSTDADAVVGPGQFATCLKVDTDAWRIAGGTGTGTPVPSDAKQYFLGGM